METFKCCLCGLTKEVPTSGGTGYATNPSKPEEKTCYDCMGKLDLCDLTNAKVGDTFMHYLTKKKDGNYEVINWPGTLRIDVEKYTVTGHQRKRYNTVFRIAGKTFKGITYGDDNQCHKIIRLR